MSAYAAPEPDYAGPAYRSSAGSNKPIRRIVIHSTVSPCVPGGAASIASYFRSKRAGGSAHYVVDPVEALQVVYDSVIAWHAPPNPGSLGVELCDMPDQNVKRWNDEHHRRMLDNAVELVAGLCLAYDVPPWFRGPVGLRLGRRGITTHNNVSLAFRQSTHWDPGAWPRRRFMRAVRKSIKTKRAAAKRQQKKGRKK